MRNIVGIGLTRILLGSGHTLFAEIGAVGSRLLMGHVLALGGRIGRRALLLSEQHG
jgi:hypothetical protein